MIRDLLEVSSWFQGFEQYQRSTEKWEKDTWYQWSQGSFLINKIINYIFGLIFCNLYVNNYRWDTNWVVAIDNVWTDIKLGLCHQQNLFRDHVSRHPKIHNISKILKWTSQSLRWMKINFLQEMRFKTWLNNLIVDTAEMEWLEHHIHLDLLTLINYHPQTADFLI